MKIKLNAEELSKRLEHLLKVVPSKPTIQILSSVLIETKGDVAILTASDSEVWLSVKCKLDECDGGCRVCVDANDLKSLVANIGPRQVVITSDDKSCLMTCEYDNGRFSLPCENADVYPLYDMSADWTTNIVINGFVILNSIEMTRYAAADNDKLRPVLNGIHFDILQNCIITTAASLSKIAIFKEKDVPVEDGRNGGFTITKKTAAVLTSILRTFEGDIKLSFRNESVSFNNSDFKMYSRLIEYAYPDCSRIIPSEGKCIATVDRESLLLALKRITPATNDISNLVMFDFSEGKVTLSADNAQLGKSASETVKCDCDGSLSIGFKGSNVMETLKNIDDDNVVIELTDQRHAGIFYSALKYTKDEYISLCMPMLIQ